LKISSGHAGSSSIVQKIAFFDRYTGKHPNVATVLETKHGGFHKWMVPKKYKETSYQNG
jgi:hypothetical protein